MLLSGKFPEEWRKQRKTSLMINGAEDRDYKPGCKQDNFVHSRCTRPKIRAFNYKLDYTFSYISCSLSISRLIQHKSVWTVKNVSVQWTVFLTARQCLLCAFHSAPTVWLLWSPVLFWSTALHLTMLCVLHAPFDANPRHSLCTPMYLLSAVLMWPCLCV
jgi:hypothetical protein